MEPVIVKKLPNEDLASLKAIAGLAKEWLDLGAPCRQCETEVIYKKMTEEIKKLEGKGKCVQ